MKLTTAASILSASLIPFTQFRSTSASILSHDSAHPSNSLSIPLLRRSNKKLAKRSYASLLDFASSARQSAHSKYGKPTEPSTKSKRLQSKRASGKEYLVDFGNDSEYVAQVSVGTPAQEFFVIMDTGSSDFWLASSACSTGCSGIPTFNPLTSTSISTSNTKFQVQYGSGAAAGTLATDVVSLAGLTVQKQTFALASQVSSNLLDGSVSGLMGLAFQTIASSKALPLWQSLAKAGSLTTPAMSFALTRFTDVPGSSSVEPGGLFTLGEINNTLFTGNLNYNNLTDKGSYWLIQLGGISVNGNSISNFTSVPVAIDTGTSLIGGPPDQVANIFAQIPQSSPASSPQLQGYYQYPCETNVTISFKFGGIQYSMDPSDFNLGRISETMCVGGIFQVTQSEGTPDWIFGDAFLKNVYTVFSFSPLAVGFATPSTAAINDLMTQTQAVQGFIAATTQSVSGVLPSGAAGGKISGASTTISIGFGKVWSSIVGGMLAIGMGGALILW